MRIQFATCDPSNAVKFLKTAYIVGGNNYSDHESLARIVLLEIESTPRLGFDAI